MHPIPFAVIDMVRVKTLASYLNRGVNAALIPLLFLLTGFCATTASAEPGAYGGDPAAGYPSHTTSTSLPADLPLTIDHALASSLLAQSEYPTLDEDAFGEGRQREKKPATTKPITRLVPIWGELVREKGFDLPLPFGVGANMVLMDQGIDVRNLKIGFDTPNLDLSGLSFSNTRAHDRVNTLRLDMWLLPLVNVYGIFGYINGEAELKVNVPALSIDVPGIGDVPISDAQSAKLNIDYNGTTYGGGVTLAGGYKKFFASLDANYTHSNIDVASAKIDTYTVSPRLGLMVDPAAVHGSLAIWVGAMYMDYKQKVTDSIDLATLSPLLPPVELDFEIDIKNKQPWNFIFGGQWEATKRWQIMVEGGIGDRKQFITGLFFRF